MAEQLKRAEIREILRQHKGSQQAVATAAGVTRQTVNQWLRGKTTSANIARFAMAKALELLGEKRHAA